MANNKPTTPAEPLSHTPGPWTHIPRARDGHADIIASKGKGFIMVGVPVAETPVLDYPHDNVQTANAKLVSAAPDGLAANRLSLRNVESMIDHLPVKGDPTQRQSLQTWARILRDAIEKATGA